MRNKIIFIVVIVAAAVLLLAVAVASASVTLTNQEQLGKNLFFDTNLSDPAGQSCAACHGPGVGFTGLDQAINIAGAVYEGAVAGRFGARKPPAAAYAGDSPLLDFDGTNWVGGMFWDGRATGETLGDPLAEQAQGPFLNPLEQNNASVQVVIDKVLASDYEDLFLHVCTDPGTYYDCIGRAIAAYERSAEVSAYTSKFDRFYLRALAKGLDVTQIDIKNWNKFKNMGLESEELKGLAIFNTKANCSACHTLEAGPAGFPLFTDFTYDNLGVPRNPENPFYNEPDWNPQGDDWVDVGLGGFLKASGYPESVYVTEWGKFKVPTLRNVDLRPYRQFVKAFSHNGYFKSLGEIVHFYNTRDVPGAGWPAPEVAVNVNTTELGNLGLKAIEEEWIVSFLKTLSDGYKPIP